MAPQQREIMVKKTGDQLRTVQRCHRFLFYLLIGQKFAEPQVSTVALAPMRDDGNRDPRLLILSSRLKSFYFYPSHCGFW
jgi:hypothetical protein